jgi:hypothetical protein
MIKHPVVLASGAGIPSPGIGFEPILGDLRMFGRIVKSVVRPRAPNQFGNVFLLSTGDVLGPQSFAFRHDLSLFRETPAGADFTINGCHADSNKKF